MFKEHHDLFRNEVHQATGSYVIWKSLQNCPANDIALLNAMNVTPTSWIFIRHSMMLSLIMTLGRIFGTDGDSLSIDDLIKSCIIDIDVFSKSSLRDRKLQQSGEAEWLDSYIDNAYEPIEKDFQMLKSEIIGNYTEMYISHLGIIYLHIQIKFISTKLMNCGKLLKLETWKNY